MRTTINLAVVLLSLVAWVIAGSKKGDPLADYDSVNEARLSLPIKISSLHNLKSFFLLCLGAQVESVPELP